MDIMKLGAQLLSGKLGGADISQAQGAIGNLLGGADGKVDLGNLVAGMQQKGLGDVAKSWLGDGDNAAIDASQIKEMFGGAKISEMASQLGADEGTLLDGLKDAIPQMIDKSSSGGNLLDSVGGLGGLAKKFFS